MTVNPRVILASAFLLIRADGWAVRQEPPPLCSPERLQELTREAVGLIEKERGRTFPRLPKVAFANPAKLKRAILAEAKGQYERLAKRFPDRYSEEPDWNRFGSEIEQSARGMYAFYAQYEDKVYVNPANFFREATKHGSVVYRSEGFLRRVLIHELVHAFDQYAFGYSEKITAGMEFLGPDPIVMALIEGHAEYVTERIYRPRSDAAFSKAYLACLANSRSRRVKYVRGREFFERLEKRNVPTFEEQVFRRPPDRFLFERPHRYPLAGEPVRKEEIVGTLFENVAISRKILADHRRRSLAHLRYGLLRDLAQRSPRFRRSPTLLKAACERVLLRPGGRKGVSWEDVVKNATDNSQAPLVLDLDEWTWRQIALLEKANRMDIAAKPAHGPLRILRRFLFPGRENADPLIAEWLSLRGDDFDVFLWETERQEALFESILPRDFPADVKALADRVAKTDRIAHAVYAVIANPDASIPEPTPAAVLRHYRDHAEDFRISARVEVESLAVDEDRLRTTLPEPTPDEVRRYIERQKRSPLRLGKPPTPEEAREGIKRETAARQARTLLAKALAQIQAYPAERMQLDYLLFSSELLESIRRRIREARTVTPKIFFKIERELGREGHDVERGSGLVVDRESLPRVKERLGRMDGQERDRLDQWCFAEGRGLLQISPPIRTQKGIALLLVRKRAVRTGTLQRVREWIKGETKVDLAFRTEWLNPSLRKGRPLQVLLSEIDGKLHYPFDGFTWVYKEDRLIGEVSPVLPLGILRLSRRSDPFIPPLTRIRSEVRRHLLVSETAHKIAARIEGKGPDSLLESDRAMFRRMKGFSLDPGGFAIGPRLRWRSDVEESVAQSVLRTEQHDELAPGKARVARTPAGDTFIVYLEKVENLPLSAEEWKARLVRERTQLRERLRRRARDKETERIVREAAVR